ncbi:MAG: sugar nucleotide-binding protein [Planctomycetota bacterium]
MTAAKPESTHALIVGGDSSIGQAVATAAQSRGWTHTRTSRRANHNSGAVSLDLSDHTSLKALRFPPPPCRVFLLAAVTSLRTCEQRPEATGKINAAAVAFLAERAAHAGATPTLVSTNLVFDGTHARVPPNAPRHPQTAYGKQKASAEDAVLQAGGVVVRPTKVLPPEPPMLAVWRDALRRGERVEAFTDLWFAPVPISTVIDALLDAPPGIRHVSGRHDISYYEAAQHIAQQVNADPALVVAAKAADVGIPTPQRPRHTTLACDEPYSPWDVLDQALSLG